MRQLSKTLLFPSNRCRQLGYGRNWPGNQINTTGFARELVNTCTLLPNAQLLLLMIYLYMSSEHHWFCSPLLSVITLGCRITKILTILTVNKRSCLVSDCIKLEIGHHCTCDQVFTPNKQTDVADLTNELPEAMSQTQPSFVRDDDVDPTNESHIRRDFSVSSLLSGSSSSSPSSSLHPSLTTTHSSVLFQGFHPHNHHHNASQLFQKLSLLDNQSSDTSTPMARRKLPLSRLTPSSSRQDPKDEKKVKKPVSRKKRTPLKFKHYRHPGTIAAITSALEALDTHDDDSMDTQPVVNGLDHSMVLGLENKSPKPATSSTTDEHAMIESPIQHQHVANRDIMRIASVLNDSAQTMSGPTASGDDASPSPSPESPSMNMPDHYLEHSNTDIIDIADVRSQIAKYGLRSEYLDMLTDPARQRYEEALVEIVGDLELPFFGGRHGSAHE